MCSKGKLVVLGQVNTCGRTKKKWQIQRRNKVYIILTYHGCYVMYKQDSTLEPVLGDYPSGQGNDVAITHGRF